MKRIKIIKEKTINLQKEIDKWIKEEKPTIESTSITSFVLQNGNIQNIISIVYDENVRIDNSKIIKNVPKIK